MSFPKFRWRVRWYLLVVEQGVVSIELWSAVLRLVGSFESWNGKWTFLAVRIGWRRENWVLPMKQVQEMGTSLIWWDCTRRDSPQVWVAQTLQIPRRSLTLLALWRWLLSLWNILPFANAFVYRGLGQALSVFPEGDWVLISFHREMVN